MTRGPLPKKAIARAIDTGAIRGMVRDAAEIQESHHDFIIFGESCTIFVRVRRIQTHIINPADFKRKFSEDIFQIRRVPGTPVVSREIWVLSPWRCWQYFLILDDRIIEIQRNGIPVAPVVPGAGKKAAPASPVVALTETERVAGPIVTGSDIVPVMTVNESAPSLPGTGIITPRPAIEPPVINDLSVAGVPPATPVPGMTKI